MSVVALRKVGRGILEGFHRSWDFGPPAGDAAGTPQVSVFSDLSQFGLSFQLSFDGDGRDLQIMFGPLDIRVSMPPSAWSVRRQKDHGPEYAADWPLLGRVMHAYLHFAHVGASVEWYRVGKDLCAHLKLGPFGVVVEPAY